jgi:hypothetical protein
VLVRAEADKVAAAAKDLAAKGLEALKNIDKEKVKCPWNDLACVDTCP